MKSNKLIVKVSFLLICAVALVAMSKQLVKEIRQIDSRNEDKKIQIEKYINEYLQKCEDKGAFTSKDKLCMESQIINIGYDNAEVKYLEEKGNFYIFITYSKNNIFGNKINPISIEKEFDVKS